MSNIKSTVIDFQSKVSQLATTDLHCLDEFVRDSLTQPDDNKLTEINEKLKISVFGLGYVGIVSSACFCKLGHTVIGVDPDDKKIDSLNLGQSPIVEKDLTRYLTQGIESGRLSAMSDALEAVKNSDVSLVSVGTPTAADGSCMLDYLFQAAKNIAVGMRLKNTYHLVVFRSTVPPKTTQDLLIPILEKFSGKKCGVDFGVCFNPEFLRESTAINDFHHPAKTVIGAIDQRSAKIAAQLYRGVEGEVIETSLQAAEFVKCIDNTWHALKVSFANEVGRMCKSMDIDSQQVMDIFVQDKKLNLSSYYLKPGFAFGGSCLPKDTRSMMDLAKKHNVKVPLIDSLLNSNNRHLEHALKLIERQGCKTIGVVGLTFKSGTDDLRESPTLDLIKKLKSLGYQINYLDKNVSPEQLLKSGFDKDSMITPSQHFFDLIRSSEMLVIAHQGDYSNRIVHLAKQYIPVVDLVGLAAEFKGEENYQGICW